jgi:predicted DNA-binding transcriptional regulator AlpA
VSQSASGPGHSPIAELVGLVEGVRLLEEHIAKCVAACCEEGYGATEVARILGVHRATVYRLSSWRERPRREASGPSVGGPTSRISDWQHRIHSPDCACCGPFGARG